MSVELDLTDSDLNVHMKGASGVLALRSRIDVPLTHVTGARVVTTDEAKAEGHGFKVGSHIPGLVRTGSFGVGDAKQFWYVLHAEEVLVVDLLDESYRRLVLEVDDPAAAAARITAALPA